MQSSCFLILILLISSCSLASASWFASTFLPDTQHGPTFSSEGFHLLDNIGLPKGAELAAFGDFNSDKYTDVFLISEDKQRVDLYFWNHKKWEFELNVAATITPFQSTKKISTGTPDEFTITNISPSDFNSDGRLDVLISYKKSTKTRREEKGTKRAATFTDASPSTTFVVVYFGNYQTFYNSSFVGEMYDQPLLVDIDGDLLTDLFSGSHEDGKPTFWIFNKERSSYDRVVQTPSEELDSAPTHRLIRGEFLFTKTLARPHSHSLVDVNGDCISDLVITTATVDEFGVETKHANFFVHRQGSFVYHNEVTLPRGAGQLSFADYNGDGNIDFLVPVCYPQPHCELSNSVVIAYNTPHSIGRDHVCQFFEIGDCLAAEDLCSAHLNSSWVLEESKLKEQLLTDEDYKSHPTTIRIGDVNIDGYPDLLVPVVLDSITTVQVMINEECTDKKDINCIGERKFKKLQDKLGDMSKLHSVTSAAFFDLDEDGKLDILLKTSDKSAATSTPTTSSSSSSSLVALLNNFEYDALFIKSLGLNGVCSEWCSSEPQFPDPKPYGVNYHGGTFKFIMTELSGRKKIVAGSQLSQSSYSSLQVPYFLIGLGRTSSYIDIFFYGSGKSKNYWSGIIPNSQVVVIPHPPSDPTNWTLELYLTPSGVTLWVIVSVVGCIIFCSLVVLFFRWREKKEDELEKKERAHLFSFDAL